MINLAVAFPTHFGTRILLTGFSPSALGPLLTGELRKIPGVKGAYNYLIDSKGTVLASNDPGETGRLSLHQTGAGARAQRRRRVTANGHYYDQAGISNSSWRIC